MAEEDTSELEALAGARGTPEDTAKSELGVTPGPSAAEQQTRRFAKQRQHSILNAAQDISSDEEYEALEPGTRFMGPDRKQRVKPYAVKSDEDYDTVPEGAQFVDPDGQTRTKPRAESIGYSAETLYQMARTPETRRQALALFYDKDKIKQDTRGEFYIDDEGKTRRPGRGVAGFAGTMTAEAAPTLGMTFGGQMGAQAAEGAGPVLGVVGAGGGAMLGAAAGRQLNNVVLGLAGIHETFPEQVKSMAGEAAGVGAGELAGRGIAKIPAALMATRKGATGVRDTAGSLRENLPKVLEQLGVTPERARKFLGTPLETAQRASDITAEQVHIPGMPEGQTTNVKVPPSVYAPEAPMLKKIEEFDRVFRSQDVVAQSWEALYNKQVPRILANQEIGVGLDELATRATKKVSSERAGQQALAAVQRDMAHDDAGLENARRDAIAQARRPVDQLGGEEGAARFQQEALDRLKAAHQRAQETATRYVQAAAQDLRDDIEMSIKMAAGGEDTSDLNRAIAAKYQAYNVATRQRASTMYEAANDAAGGARIDASGLSQEADAFLKSLPEQVRQKYPGEIAQLAKIAQALEREGQNEPVDTTMSFGDLHKLRSWFRYGIDYMDQTPDMKQGSLKLFEKKINDLLHAGQEAGGEGAKSEGRLLGTNAEGQKVYERQDGRRVAVSADGNRITESPGGLVSSEFYSTPTYQRSERFEVVQSVSEGTTSAARLKVESGDQALPTAMTAAEFRARAPVEAPKRMSVDDPRVVNVATNLDPLISELDKTFPQIAKQLRTIRNNITSANDNADVMDLVERLGDALDMLERNGVNTPAMTKLARLHGDLESIMDEPMLNQMNANRKMESYYEVYRDNFDRLTDPKAPWLANTSEKDMLRSLERPYEASGNDELYNYAERTAYEQAAKVLRQRASSADSRLKVAVGLLDQADRFYKDNIPFLDDHMVQGTIDMLKSGEGANPEALAKMFFNPERTSSMRRARGIVGENLWKGVQAADVRQMLDNSRLVGSADIDGARFAQQVEQRLRDGILESGYDAKLAARVQKIVTDTRKLAGDLPITAEPGDTISTLMRKIEIAQQEAEKFAEMDPLAALKKATSEIDTRHNKAAQAAKKSRQQEPLHHLYEESQSHLAVKAADKILGSQDLIMAAATQFGRDSPEFNALRQVYASRFLQRAFPKTAAMRAELSGEKGMTEEVQALMFPGITRDQMVTLAKNMEFLFSAGGTDIGGSLAAAARVLHPEANFPIQFKALKLLMGVPGASTVARYTLGKFYALAMDATTHPNFINWLANRLEGDAFARAEARAAIQQRIRMGALLGRGFGQQALTPKPKAQPQEQPEPVQEQPEMAQEQPQMAQ